MSEELYQDYSEAPQDSNENYGENFEDESHVDPAPDYGSTSKQKKKPADLKGLVPYTLIALVLLVALLFIAGIRKAIRDSDRDRPPATLEQNDSDQSSSGIPDKNHSQPLEIPQYTDTSPAPRQSSNSSPQAIIQRVKDGIVFITANKSGLFTSGASGTGFVINPDGYILTNDHVVDNADSYRVYFQDGTSAAAKLIAADSDLDVALLQVAQKTSTIFLDLGSSSTVQIGQEVFALGFPLGAKLGRELSVTEGIISSIRQAKSRPWFQISAAVNSGNSGGPLIRKDTGEVIGVITAKIHEADNIGFARPIDLCKNFVSDYTYF